MPAARWKGTPMPHRLHASLPDWYAAYALAHGDLRVDLDTGAIYGRDGTRAELLDRRSGAGLVVVCKTPRRLAQAHRVVWIAMFGPIPRRATVRHLDGRKWHNVPGNLVLDYTLRDVSGTVEDAARGAVPR